MSGEPPIEISSVSDEDFDEITNKVGKSLAKRLKEQSEAQQEMLKMLSIMQNKVETLTKNNQGRNGYAEGQISMNPSLQDSILVEENTYVPYARSHVDDFPRLGEDCDRNRL